MCFMKKYLLIGGEFENKGAEAMAFATIQAIRNRDSSAKIYMLLSAEHMDKEMIDSTGVIGVLDQPSRRMYAAGGLERFTTIIRGKNKDKNFYELSNVVSSVDCIIDISGYSFTSVWGLIPAISGCSLLTAAKKHNVPYYIMPQSFGPFDYQKIVHPYMIHKIKRALSSAKIIYAREDEGYNLLTKQFNLKNVVRSYDMILQCKEYRQKDIFIKPVSIFELDVNQNRKNAAIIPNIRNNKYASEESVLSFYDKFIEELLKNDYVVNIISHSREDADECQKIKELYSDNAGVVYVNRDLSCIEYELCISKFDICIASRFHSIVHAYKAGVPCIGFGWATKYIELMELFGQSSYWVDVKKLDTIDPSSIVKKLVGRQSTEKLIIRKKVYEIQKEDCLDIISKEI